MNRVSVDRLETILARGAGLGLLSLVLLLSTGCGQNARSTFEKAAELYKKKNPVGAEDHLRKTLAIQSDFLPAYLLLGRLAAEREDDQSVVLNYRNAFDIVSGRDFKLREEDILARDDPALRLQWEEAAFNLASAEFRNENYNRAIYYYDTILNCEESINWKKKAYEEKQVTREFFEHKKKLNILRQQNYKDPEDPRVKSELAALFMEMSSGLTRLGNLKIVSEYIAMSAEWRGQAEDKLRALYDASPEVKLPQTEALLAYTESQEKLMRGRYEEALAKAREACEKDSTDAKYQFAVASILQIISSREDNSADRSDEIIAFAKRAVELKPDVWRYLIFYAGRLRDQGQLEDSYQVLLKVREVTSDKDVLQEVEDTLAALESAIAAGESGVAPSATQH